MVNKLVVKLSIHGLHYLLTFIFYKYLERQQETVDINITFWQYPLMNSWTDSEAWSTVIVLVYDIHAGDSGHAWWVLPLCPPPARTLQSWSCHCQSCPSRTSCLCSLCHPTPSLSLASAARIIPLFGRSKSILKCGISAWVWACICALANFEGLISILWCYKETLKQAKLCTDCWFTSTSQWENILGNFFNSFYSWSPSP